MSETLQGRRAEWPTEGLLVNGEYAIAPTGEWHAMTPNGHLANLGRHDVTEHEDGTITASPSILVRLAESGRGDVFHRDGPHDGELWHGFLERGVWRSV